MAPALLFAPQSYHLRLDGGGLEAVRSGRGLVSVFSSYKFSSGEWRCFQVQDALRSMLCVMSMTMLCMYYVKCMLVAASRSGADGQSMTLVQQQEEAPLGYAWCFLLLLSQSHVLLVCARVRSRM